MYVLALDYKQLFAAAVENPPPIRQIDCSLSHIYPYVFKTFDLSFMFHFLL